MVYNFNDKLLYTVNDVAILWFELKHQKKKFNNIQFKKVKKKNQLAEK